MQTSSTADSATAINFKRTTSKFQEYDIRKGTFLQGEYVMFTIGTEADDGTTYKVQRTDDDIYSLRKLMMVATPHVMVPPLPKKTLKTAPKKIHKRQRLYQRFVNAVHKSEILKTSKAFFNFISMSERNEWLQAVKTSERTKIFDLVTDDG
jgi:hypothetical protein